MTSWLRCLLAAIVVAVVAWLGLPSAAALPTVTPALPHTYAHVASLNEDLAVGPVTERGPPSKRYDYNTTHPAVDSAHGASVCLHPVATSEHISCTHLPRPVWAGKAGTTTGRLADLVDGDLRVDSLSGVAAETAGTALDASELSAGQASNYARYAKKLPSGARDPVITRGANGSVQFSADVPGRVPGSYATYTKIVDSGGTTTDYYKTTVAPDGSIVHVKIKFP